MIKDLDELEKLDHAQGIMNGFDLAIPYQSIWIIYSKLPHELDRLYLVKLLNILVTTEETLKSSRGRDLTIEQASTFKRKSAWKKNKKPMKKQKKENKPKKDAPKKAADKKKYFHYNIDGH